MVAAAAVCNRPHLLLQGGNRTERRGFGAPALFMACKSHNLEHGAELYSGVCVSAPPAPLLRTGSWDPDINF